MRPLFVAILAVLILGGVKWFIDSDPAHARANQPAAVQIAQSKQTYDVELQLTFSAGPDEFSIDVSDAPSLVLMLNGKEILKRTDTVSAESAIRLSDVDELVVGENEFLVQASPGEQDGLPKALRLRVLRGQVVIAEQLAWAESGDLVQATMRLEVSE